MPLSTCSPWFSPPNFKIIPTPMLRSQSPHLCQFRDYDIQTLSEYVMTYYVESLQVLCLQIKIASLCFLLRKCMKYFYVRPATWVATVPVKDCYNPSTGEGYCNFFFSFCKLLPHGQCFNSSFCQAGPNPVNFGVFNKNQKILKVRTISMQLL